MDLLNVLRPPFCHHPLLVKLGQIINFQVGDFNGLCFMLYIRNPGVQVTNFSKIASILDIFYCEKFKCASSFDDVSARKSCIWLISLCDYMEYPGPYAGLNEGGVVNDCPKGGERR